MSKVTQARWIVSGLTEEQAKARFVGKQFKVAYSTEHELLVRCDTVSLYGGVVMTFCSVVKVLKRWKKDQTVFSKKSHLIHAGRLEEVKIGGTI